MKTGAAFCGLGFGDEGKGSIVDAYVARTQADLVVRFNGGMQAGHHVHVPGSTNVNVHCFSQFGAGTFAGAKTHLSRFMLIDPLLMEAEAAALMGHGLREPWRLVTIAPEAQVVTVYHRALNRCRELSRGDQRHGSCGMGIGEAVSDGVEGRLVLRAHHVSRPDHTLYEMLRELYAEKKQQAAELQQSQAFDQMVQGLWPEDLMRAYLSCAPRLRLKFDADALADANHVVFEGAQGVLLDEQYGFHPHTTWSSCTFKNVETLLADAGVVSGNVFRFGVTRAYSTRHGAGPFPSEVSPDKYVLHGDAEDNSSHGFQGTFRIGALDCVLLRYAKEVVRSLDGLAVTCLDRRRDERWWLVNHHSPKGLYTHPVRARPTLQEQQHLGELLLLRQEPTHKTVTTDSLLAHLASIVAQIVVQSHGKARDAKIWGPSVTVAAATAKAS